MSSDDPDFFEKLAKRCPETMKMFDDAMKEQYKDLMKDENTGPTE